MRRRLRGVLRAGGPRFGRGSRAACKQLARDGSSGDRRLGGVDGGLGPVRGNPRRDFAPGNRRGLPRFCEVGKCGKQAVAFSMLGWNPSNCKRFALPASAQPSLREGSGTPKSSVGKVRILLKACDRTSSPVLVRCSEAVLLGRLEIQNQDCQPGLSCLGSRTGALGHVRQALWLA